MPGSVKGDEEEKLLEIDDETVWLVANYLSLAREAKSRSESLDATLDYVTRRCDRILDREAT